MRLALTVCIGIAAASLGFAAPNNLIEETSYLGGTVTTIPRNALGKLDLRGESEIVFLYRDPHWSLPYDKVRAIEYDPGEVVTRRRTIQTLGFAKLPMFASKPQLTIKFESGVGQTEKVVLELPKKQALTTLARLEEKTGKKAVPPTYDGGRERTDGANWWGDRYWRTNRNQQTWDAAKN
ncbi:MAG: hypothetical protein SFV54_12915 [Bryobacteraceae bacterium]|nr:hypothetical protein [Bryobacteraceae bacterium]